MNRLRRHRNHEATAQIDLKQVREDLEIDRLSQLDGFMVPRVERLERLGDGLFTSDPDEIQTKYSMELFLPDSEHSARNVHGAVRAAAIKGLPLEKVRIILENLTLDKAQQEYVTLAVHLDMIAVRRAILNVALERVGQGVVLNDVSKGTVKKAMEGALRSDLNPYDTNEYDLLCQMVVAEGLNAYESAPEKLGPILQLTKDITHKDSNKIRHNVLVTLSSLQQLAQQHPSESVIQTTQRLISTADVASFDERDVKLFNRLTKQIVLQYNGYIEAENYVLADRAKELVVSRGVTLENDTPAQPSLTTLKSAKTIPAPPLVPVTNRGLVKELKLNENGLGGRATIARRGVMTGAALGVVMSTIPSAPTAATTLPQQAVGNFILSAAKLKVTEHTPIKANDYEDTLEGVIVPTETQPDTPETTPENTLQPEKNDSTHDDQVRDAEKAAKALAEPVNVNIGRVNEKTAIKSNIPDATIISPDTIKKGVDDGWSAEVILDTTTNDDFIKEYPRVDSNTYLDEVEDFISELDAYIAARGDTITSDELKQYRTYVLYAKLLSEHPSFLVRTSIEELGVKQNDFSEEAKQLLREAGLVDEDGLYTEQQEAAIIALLTAAYEISLSDEEKKQITDLGEAEIPAEPPEPAVPEKPKKKGPKGFLKKNPGHKPDNHGDNENRGLNEKEIRNKILNKMEGMGPQWKNRAKTIRAFMEAGYTAKQAAGVVGNKCVEAAGCELDPTIEQIGGGPGRGGYQHGAFNYDLDRFGHDIDGKKGVDHEGTLRWFANKFYGDADKWKLIEVQDKFALWELENTEINAGRKLRKASTLYEATDIVLNDFERPGERHIDLRLKYARQTHAMYKKIERELTKQNKAAPDSRSEKPGSRYESYDSIKKRLQQRYGEKSGMLPPSELQKIGSDWGDERLQNDAAETYRLLAKTFEDEFGKKLDLSGGGTGYRSYAAQVKCRKEKGNLCAVPGTSEHGWGMAVDISTHVVTNWDSKEYEWLLRNAPKYGWFKPNWSRQKGDKPELWHWEYQGGIRKNSLPERESRSDRDKFVVSDKGFTLPVAPDKYKVSTEWDGYESRSGVHTGIDIPASIGTPVFAIKAGKVISAEVLGSTGIKNITIDHGNGEFSDYQHLNGMKVGVGDHVKLGEKIGESGNSGAAQGYSTAPHIHLGYSTTPEVESARSSDAKRNTHDPRRVLPTEKEIKEWRKKH